MVKINKCTKTTTTARLYLSFLERIKYSLSLLSPTFYLSLCFSLIFVSLAILDLSLPSSLDLHQNHSLFLSQFKLLFSLQSSLDLHQNLSLFLSQFNLLSSLLFSFPKSWCIHHLNSIVNYIYFHIFCRFDVSIDLFNFSTH